MTSTKTSAKRTTKKTSEVFSAAEREAMQDAKTERRKGKKADGESDLLAKVAELKGLDREIAEKIHAVVKANAPGLSPRTWYGMPAWADDTGKAVCFFTPAAKFKERYATLGFNANAKLDDGNMWPTAFALTKMTGAEEQRIAALIKTAVG